MHSNFRMDMVYKKSPVNPADRKRAIEGLDAILEIGCKHYCTLGPVRYLADYLVAKIGELSNLLDVLHDRSGESSVGTR